MRRLLFISIFVSALLHFCLLYGFSDARLFDMQAYDSQIQGLFQVSVPTQTMSLTKVRALDESINRPEDTAPLKASTEPIAEKQALQKLAEDLAPELSKLKVKAKELSKPTVDLNASKQAVNQAFRLDLKSDATFNEKLKQTQQAFASDLITPPQRTQSQAPLIKQGVISGAGQLPDETVKSTFYSVPSQAGAPAEMGGAQAGGSGGFFSREVRAIKVSGPAYRNALVYQHQVPDQADLELVRVNKGELELRGDMAEVVTADFDVYQDAKTGEDYVRIVLRPRSDSSQEVLPKDLLFLIDVSGSIEYDQLKQIRKEITDCLMTQNEGDRFNIVLFSVNQSQLFSDFQPINEQTLEGAHAFIQRIKGSKETDIYQALMHSAPFFKESNRVLHMIFISDGRPTEGVRDYKQIINDFTRERLGNVAFFTYDLGASGKRLLLEYLSYENRGDTFLRSEKNPTFQLPRYLESYNLPILYNLVIDQVEGESAQVYPRLLKHLYLSKPVEILARLPKPGSFGLHLTALEGSGRRRALYVAVNTEVSRHTEEKQLRALWADYKLYEMISSAFREGMTPALEQEIAAHNRQYHTRIARELKKYLN